MRFHGGHNEHTRKNRRTQPRGTPTTEGTARASTRSKPRPDAGRRSGPPIVPDGVAPRITHRRHPPIADVEQPAGPTHQRRVMGGDHRRDALFGDQGADQLHDASTPSRCPADRSARRPAGSAGWPPSALATPTRCCWPPESSNGPLIRLLGQARPARAPRRTRASPAAGAPSARSAAGFRRSPPRTASVAARTTGRRGPAGAAAARPTRPRASRPRSRPSIRTEPDVGRSSPPSRLSRVVLPDPTGRGCTTSSPANTSRSTSRHAVTGPAGANTRVTAAAVSTRRQLGSLGRPFSVRCSAVGRRSGAVGASATRRGDRAPARAAPGRRGRARSHSPRAAAVGPPDRAPRTPRRSTCSSPLACRPLRIVSVEVRPSRICTVRRT